MLVRPKTPRGYLTHLRCYMTLGHSVEPSVPGSLLCPFLESYTGALLCHRRTPETEEARQALPRKSLLVLCLLLTSTHRGRTGKVAAVTSSQTHALPRHPTSHPTKDPLPQAVAFSSQKKASAQAWKASRRARRGSLEVRLDLSCPVVVSTQVRGRQHEVPILVCID